MYTKQTYFDTTENLWDIKSTWVLATEGYNDDRTRREGYNRSMLTGIIISITPLNGMLSVTDNWPSDTLDKVKTENQKSWFCSEHV